MRILSVGTALPGPLRPQSELLAELAMAWGDKVTDRERSLLERLAKSAGVRSKHLAMDPDQYKQIRQFTDRNRVFQSVGTELAIQAIKSACSKANLDASDLDAIYFTTVTGLSVPSMDARVAETLGLNERIKRVPMFGLGCVAGAAGIARVHDYLKAWPAHAVVLLSVELCSLTLQLDDLSPESIVASALFGDGAAAVICVGDDHPLASRAPLRTLASMSRLYPRSAHIMGWDIGSHGFKILLDPGVPQIVERYFADDVKTFLGESQLTITDIKTWISHPGGPKVLKAIEACLGLPAEALSVSWRQLETLGNLSSASVLSILGETLDRRTSSHASRGDHALMMAMGPGFCSEQVLCAWT